jgi:putative two-component system response regulator
MRSELRTERDRVCLLASETFAREVQELAPDQIAADAAVVVSDVDTTLEALEAQPASLILVDLRLVGADSLRLVSRLGASGPATLVVGGAEDLDTIRRALELGASGSLIAPFHRVQLLAAIDSTSELHERVLDRERRIRDLEHATGQQQHALQTRTEQLGAALKQRMASEQAALLAQEETVHCLARAIESRDIGTGAHVERMSSYCELIADELGLHDQAHMIGLAARLHDVGKVAVPDFILLKQSPLTDDERVVMQWHCRTGHATLAETESELLRLAAVIALSHHEWYDGSGYPDGLAGEAIPVAGRITAIADSFDALTNQRPYRRALTFQQATEILLGERGTHFDPVMLDLFLGSAQLRRIHGEGA